MSKSERLRKVDLVCPFVLADRQWINGFDPVAVFIVSLPMLGARAEPQLVIVRVCRVNGSSSLLLLVTSREGAQDGGYRVCSHHPGHTIVAVRISNGCRNYGDYNQVTMNSSDFLCH